MQEGRTEMTRMVFSYHAYRIYTHPLGLEAGIAELAVAGISHVGVPYQHHAEPYVVVLRQHGLRVVYTIGAHERPYANAFGKGDGCCWDLEGGGDPVANALWFANLYRKLDRSAKRLFYDQLRSVGVYSGYPGCLYGGQTIAARYSCNWPDLQRTFSAGYGHLMPWPTACCGGIRGPLPPGALAGMPPGLPVLHAIASPDPTLPEAEQWAQVREDTRDRLGWIKRGMGKGLCLVQAVDGPAGARWSEADSRYCAIIGEEIANV